MEYPTPEEEYELMYGEELEMMDDFDGEKLNSSQKIFCSIVFLEPENLAAKKSSTQKPAVNNTENASIISSPALSQISRHGLSFTPTNLKSSTPFLQKLKNFRASDERQEEDVANGALHEIQNIGVKRKRRLEDLFGDIYDIQEEEEDQYFKKPKTDEEKDFDTIERIVEARRAFQTQLNPLKKTQFDRFEALHKFKKDHLSRTIPK